MGGWNKSSCIAKKAVAALAASATLFCGLNFMSATPSYAAEGRDSFSDTIGNSTFETARQTYGLTEQMRDGATLHAWEWSFNTIKSKMKEIAEAGYTSVQTEPVSAIHSGHGMMFGENWYFVYQPTDTTIGNWVMGSEQDFKDMCAEAHKYGVRIIVDIVANHMTADYSAIAGRWQNYDYYHHDCNGENIQNWNDRYQVTHCKLTGLWDINTENQTTANMQADFIKNLVSDGADGFRYDAAKHIELPNEYNNSNYWNTVLANGSQYQYGEILSDSISRDGDYASMFNSSSIGGGGITASRYGHSLRGLIASSNLNAGSIGGWQTSVSPDNLTTWVESHDNYANGDRESTWMNDWQLTMGWAVIGARAEGMPLFFDRPLNSGGNQPQFSEQTKLGDEGSPLWYDPSIVAVNKFRNKMNGNLEYLRNCNGNSCLSIERYRSSGGSADTDGMVVVNMGGQANLSGQDTKLADGTYEDQINGGSITVSGGRITSGTAKEYAVSAFFNVKGSIPVESVEISGAGLSDKTLNLTEGKTSKLTATVKPDNASDKNVTWTSSDASVASVSSDGTVTAVRASGSATATITATAGGKSDSITVKVAEDPSIVHVTSVTVSGDASVMEDKTIQLSATVKPDNATNKNVTWSSSDDSVATVSSNGTVTGVNAGTVDIIATADGISAKKTITVQTNPDAGTVIYYPASKFGANSTYIHYSTDGGTTWTPVPGEKMDSACDGWVKKTIKVKNGTAINFVFNDGGNNWDNNGGSQNSYFVKAGGSFTVADGTIISGVNACNATPGVKGEVTVYYPASAFGADSTYIHYQIGTGEWTAVPGEKMEAACDGWVKKTVKTNGSNLTYVFNNGNGNWDSNWDSNYSAADGSVAIKGASGFAPCSVAVETVKIDQSAPSVKEGATVKLTATVENGPASPSLVWSSSNTSVATVASDGTVTGKKAGTAVITVNADNTAEDSVTVTVTKNEQGHFSDVQPGDWGYTEIEWAAESAISTGYADGRFGVNDNCTRAQMAKFLRRLAKSLGDKSAMTYTPTAAEWNKFSDVKRDTFAGESILWLASQGISTGYTDGRFGVNDNCTRAQMAKFLRRLAKHLGNESAVNYTPTAAEWNKFSDVKRDTFAAESILWLASQGISTGYADGRFGVNDNCTRGQMAVFLYRENNVINGGSDKVLPESVSITGAGVSGGKLSVKKGNSAQLSADIKPANATDKSVTWSSSNAGAATVSASGLVQAKAAGTAVVTVKTTNGKTASVTVTVTDSPAPTPGTWNISKSFSGDSPAYGENVEFTLESLDPESEAAQLATWTVECTGVNGDVHRIYDFRGYRAAFCMRGNTPAGKYTVTATVNGESKSVTFDFAGE